ncbi:MAG: hypothetical protein IPP94_08685 [Ignavibacteria bacterium]|nr:hypothetical protein [Ignavibacteria bacterium]
MKTLFTCSLVLVFTAVASGQSFDRLSVRMSPDTVAIVDSAYDINCGVEFAISVTVNGGDITIMQTDTGRSALCVCNFEIVTKLAGYAPGSYTARVYRTMKVWYPNVEKDSTWLVGTVAFDILGAGLPTASYLSLQSDCFILGIDAPPQPVSASVYPLPIRNDAMLRLGAVESGPVRIRLIDATGRTMQQLWEGVMQIDETKELRLPASAFPASGMHHVVIETPAGIRGLLVPVVR